MIIRPRDDVRSMYTNGHTIEYIAHTHAYPSSQIDAIIQGIDTSDQSQRNDNRYHQSPQ